MRGEPRQQARQRADDSGVGAERAEPGEVPLERRELGGRYQLLEQELEGHLAGGRRPAVHQRRGGAAQQARQAQVGARRLMAGVGGVAAEQLVRPLAGQHDLDVGPRGVGQQVSGEDRRVADGLGQRTRDYLQGVTERLVVGSDDVVHGADVVGDGLGEHAFVVSTLYELDRVGVDLLPGFDPRRRGREER